MDSIQLLWTQIGAGVSTVLFGGTLFNLLRLRSRIAAAARWTRVEGVILASEVHAPLVPVSDDQDDATPTVRYRYRVGEREFESDRTMIGGEPLTTRMLARRLVARYPVGALVDVHVDPKDPANAVLDPTHTSNLAALTALMVTFGAIAAVLIAHTIAGRVLYTSNGVPLFAFLLPAAAFAAAIASVLSFAGKRRLASASSGWPTVPGKITSSTVIEELIEEHSDDDEGRIKIIRRYQVDLRYAYRVGRRDLVGLNAHWGWTGVYGLRDLAGAEASRYPEGQAVTVYYDPQHPANAVLEPGGRQGSAAPLAFGAVCAIVGMGFLIFFLRVGFA
ncbi:MAG: DUF3592 domain-containing protein [Bradyrhizobium sp.]|uniref:DUF3592 domain-containing protein n=1 Tax=Bradyrhizobium sp. TaxID=376 RepID=UPI0025C0609D|nr:DUF3592 domain-containing protein [Bradyrhizobium sp.]MBI5261333.1 DUF3592 domain-containing protein [Bradyrhizobium sp.]